LRRFTAIFRQQNPRVALQSPRIAIRGLCWLACIGLLTLAEARVDGAPPETPLPSLDTTASGDQFLAEVLATLERRPSVAARLRYQARVHEETLMGSGKYWQRGVGNQRVTRWEMQTQVAGQPASYVQVFDGTHLWTDRTLPSGRTVHRLDVGRLQSRLRTATVNARLPQAKAPWDPLLAEAAGQGGLTELLADLLQRYTFAPPRTVQLNGLAVYALVGQWRRTELEKLWPELATAESTASWPRQLPHHVLLLAGKNNLFPYVIEHRRVADASLAASAVGDRPARDPLVRYELFEVQFAAAMDDSLFEFKPGDVQWSDETTLVLERLHDEQAAAADAAATEAARRQQATSTR